MINKRLLILTSLLILLPMLFGIFTWDNLPETMAIHWGINNEANGFASKEFTVLGIPLILLCLQCLCTYLTVKVYKEELKNFTLFIIPTVGLLVAFVIYGTALNLIIDIALLANLILGFAFMFMGYISPSLKQSKTLGIKTKATLSNEEVWNKTHKFAGRLWLSSGIMIILFAILELYSVTLGIMTGCVIIPIIYAYKISK